eukprot:1145070-Pelagomonas_calceolata.AAC.1
MQYKALSLCVKALSKGRYGTSLIGMDGCRNVRLLDQGIQVPENISRAIPDWVFPCSTGSPVLHQSQPDALFVRPIPGRQAHLDPSEIPPQDRDIHLVELNSALTRILLSFFESAATQHSHAITKLKTRSSKSFGILLANWAESGLLGGSLLGARRRRTGEGESRRPGAWWTTLQIPISSFWLSPWLAVSSVGLEGLLVRPLTFQLGDLPLIHAAFGLR